MNENEYFGSSMHRCLLVLLERIVCLLPPRRIRAKASTTASKQCDPPKSSINYCIMGEIALYIRVAFCVRHVCTPHQIMSAKLGMRWQ